MRIAQYYKAGMLEQFVYTEQKWHFAWAACSFLFQRHLKHLARIEPQKKNQRVFALILIARVYIMTSFECFAHSVFTLLRPPFDVLALTHINIENVFYERRKKKKNHEEMKK